MKATERSVQFERAGVWAAEPMDGPSLPYREIERIYGEATVRASEYNELLSHLRANDVALSVHPPLRTFLSPKTVLRRARIRNFGHALLDCLMLRRNPHRGTYIHAEWVLGWLRKDGLLRRVFDGIPVERRSTLFSDEFLHHLEQHRNQDASFDDQCMQFLSSTNGRLGPGIRGDRLDRSGMGEDVLLTASLKPSEHGFLPVLKMFGGHRDRPVIWGSAACSFSGEDLTPCFVRAVIAGQPVRLPDMRILDTARLTPRFLLRPNRYFERTNPGPCVTYTVAAVHAALSNAIEEKPFLDQDMSRLMDVSNQFRSPLPRNSFYRFFRTSFANAYEV